MQARGTTMDFDHLLTWFLHTVSGSAILATIVGLAPIFFAVPACMYYCLLLYRDPTVQGWFKRRRSHQILKLKSRIKELEDLNDPPE